MDQTWYQDFVADENLSREMLFDLLTAANFLGIKPLLDLTCLKVTFQLTGKNAEEVSISVHLNCTISV
jgi:S-phase kinase-associated protein 1